MLIIASCLQAAGGSLERSDLTGTRPLVITSDMSKSLIGAVPDPRAVQPHLQNSLHRFSSLFESFFSKKHVRHVLIKREARVLHTRGGAIDYTRNQQRPRHKSCTTPHICHRPERAQLSRRGRSPSLEHPRIALQPKAPGTEDYEGVQRFPPLSFGILLRERNHHSLKKSVVGARPCHPQRRKALNHTSLG
jgi:hypothetical protein